MLLRRQCPLGGVVCGAALTEAALIHKFTRIGLGLQQFFCFDLLMLLDECYPVQAPLFMSTSGTWHLYQIKKGRTILTMIFFLFWSHLPRAFLLISSFTELSYGLWVSLLRGSLLQTTVPQDQWIRPKDNPPKPKKGINAITLTLSSGAAHNWHNFNPLTRYLWLVA